MYTLIGESPAFTYVGAGEDLTVTEREWASKVKSDAEGYLDAARTMYQEPSLDMWALIERISPKTSINFQKRGLQRGGEDWQTLFWEKVTHSGNENRVPRDYLRQWDRDRGIWTQANHNPHFDEHPYLPDLKKLEPDTSTVAKWALIAGGLYVLAEAAKGAASRTRGAIEAY